jgi:hypothetical protein
MARTAISVRWMLFLGAGAGSLALVLVLFWFDPSRYGFYPTCLFHKTTGLLCPACGSLRAIHQLLHGHLAAAFRFNPVLVLSLPLCAWFIGAYTVRKSKDQPMNLALPAKWIWLLAAIVLAFSIWRNLPGSPFAMLPG